MLPWKLAEIVTYLIHKCKFEANYILFVFKYIFNLLLEYLFLPFIVYFVFILSVKIIFKSLMCEALLALCM